MMMRSLIAIGMLWTCACVAHAQPTNPLLVSVGWMHSTPRDSSGPVTFTIPIHHVAKGSGYSIGNADSPALAMTYFIDDHLAGEIGLGIAPKFTLSGKDGSHFGSVKQWSPTLLLKYYFLDASAPLRPYLGIGASRTWFTNAHITNPDSNEALGDSASLSLKNAWSPVFNAGLMYQFDKNWFGGASVSYMPLRTVATVKALLDDGPLVNETRIKVNPIVTYLHVGYRF